jgi:hypothetical protein
MTTQFDGSAATVDPKRIVADGYGVARTLVARTPAVSGPR